MMTIYISAPIAGLDHRPRQAAKQAAGVAARRLRAAGFTVLCLTELPVPVPEPDWRGWLRAGIRMVLAADGMVRIPGEGRAPVIEQRLAHELGIPLRTVPGWLTYAEHRPYMDRIQGRTTP